MAGPAPHRRPFWLTILVTGLALTAAILLAAWALPALFGIEIGPRLVYLVVLLGALILVFRGTRIGTGTALRYALVWLAIGAALFLAYDFWTDPPSWLAGSGAP
jgi:hypothetical protein